MANPRRTLMVGGAVLVLGLGVRSLFLHGSSIAPNPAKKSTSVATRLMVPDGLIAPAQRVADPTSTVRPNIITPQGGILTKGRPLEAVFIQYLAEEKKFEITNDELARAQEAYSAIIKARRKLEESLAQVERIEPSHVKIVIPAYAAEGQKLRQQFGSELESILGPNRANTFLAKIEVALDRANFGWGMEDQVLDVTRQSDRGVETMEIIHGFGLPNSGPLTGISGSSMSQLSPNDLVIYSYLGHLFPKQAVIRTTP